MCPGIGHGHMDTLFWISEITRSGEMHFEPCRTEQPQMWASVERYAGIRALATPLRYARGQVGTRSRGNAQIEQRSGTPLLSRLLSKTT